MTCPPTTIISKGDSPLDSPLSPPYLVPLRLPGPVPSSYLAITNIYYLQSSPDQNLDSCHHPTLKEYLTYLLQSISKHKSYHLDILTSLPTQLGSNMEVLGVNNIQALQHF